MTPIFFLLLSLLLVSTSATTTSDTVLDSKGNPVVPGSFYYAVPIPPVITKLAGGGLTMFNNGSVTCPTFFVAQSSIRGPLDYGIPLKFTPIVNIEDTISTSLKLNIAFKYLSPPPACRRAYTNVWAMSSKKLVVLDGVEGSDDSWFTLQYGYDFDGVSYYSIAFDNKMLFTELKDNGGRLLGLHGGLPPFVSFVKEEDRSMSMAHAFPHHHMDHVSQPSGAVVDKWSPPQLGKYILDILDDIGMENSFVANFPMQKGLKLSTDMGELMEDPERYRRLVGRLLYLNMTRPDINYLVQHLSQFINQPRVPHFQAAIHVLKYLKKTINTGLFYSATSGLKLLAYTNADWRQCAFTCLSGYCVFLGKSLFHGKPRNRRLF